MSFISSSTERAGFAFATGSAMLFAIRPIFVKLVYQEGVDSETLIFYRMLISVPVYIVLLLYFLRTSGFSKATSPGLLLQAAGVGLLGYFAASYFDLLGLQYVTAQLGRMILYVYPTFVVLLGGLLFAQRISGRTVLCLVITYLGVLVIFGHDLREFGSDVPKGAFFIILSALCFAFYLLISKSLITALGSRIFTCVALISASIGIFIFYALTQPFEGLAISNKALLIIAVISIFCTVIPTFFTTAAVARIGADKTGIVAMIGPAFTSVFAVFILLEDYTLFHFIGMLLTIIGVALLERNKKSQEGA